MNKITVIVSGHVGSGKSTITEIINKSLEVQGFHVKVQHINDEVDRKSFLRDLYKKNCCSYRKGYSY